MICADCGRENRAQARFCDDCGARLRPPCPRCAEPVAADALRCEACGAELSESTSGGDRALKPALPESFAGGRYHALRLLGDGPEKWVYRARDEQLDRVVAIAVLKSGELDAEALTRLRRESDAMTRLGEHPHIVTSYDVGREAGEIFVVRRYMAGGELEARLGRGEKTRVPERDALRIGAQLLQGLEHAHRHGVIHRDVRPGNVYFDTAGRAALGGFGLARLLGGQDVADERTIVGSVAYMPPEQMLGQPSTPRSDLYSFGALLYELLCGRPPFQGDDAVAVIAKHIHAPPARLSTLVPELHPKLDRLVERLLAKEPEKRPPSAAEVREEIADLIRELDEGPTTAAPKPVPLGDLRSEGVFVGREPEVERLRRALDLALAGEGQVLLLEGEPGIGKTRMAELAASLAQPLGALALWGTCHAMETSPAYWPWVQMLRRYAEGQEAEALHEDLGPAAAEVAKLIPELLEKLPEVAPTSELGSGQARFRLFDGVSRGLRRTSKRLPLVLIFEDIHWADTASLLLLQFFAQGLGGARILILGTYRAEEVTAGHPLTATLAELARIPAYERISLEGLKERDVARFIELTSGVAPSPQVVSAVHGRTEGNPFFVTEVVRLLVAQLGTDALREAHARPIPLPESVRGVLRQRFKQLTDPCRQVLSTASAVGREFRLEVLESACGLARKEFRDALEEAVSARLVHPIAERRGHYRFGHQLIREALYKELGHAQQVRLHARVGDILEQHFPDTVEEHLAGLAHHFVRAIEAGAPAQKALDYSLRAAERATRLLAHEEAVEHYQRAQQVLELHRPDDRELRCELLLALGTALWKIGKMDRSKATFRSAGKLAREIGRPEALGRAALGYGGTGYTGVWETTGAVNRLHVELLEEALARLGSGDSALRARLLGRLGIALYWDRTPERRDELTREAVEMADRLGDPVVRWHASSARHLATWGPDNLDERRQRTARMVELALQAGSSELAAQARIWHFAALLEAGAIEAATEEFEAYRKLAWELREPQYLWRASMLDATRAMMQGDLQRAEKLVFQGWEFAETMTDANRLQAFAIQLSLIRREQGRLGEIEGSIESVLARFPNIPSWRVAAGVIYYELGRTERAQAAVNGVARNEFRDVPRDYLWLATLVGASELCSHLGDVGHAALFYDLLLPYEERNVLVGDAALPLGPAAWYLGLLAGTLGRTDAAERHLALALETCQKLQLPLHEARARLSLAELLVDRRDASRYAEARQHLDQALDLARHLGSRLILEHAVDRKLRMLGIDPSAETAIGLVAARVQAARPGLASHVSPEGMVTLVFTDMEGFTRMTERLGDQQAHRVAREHNAIVREQVQRQGGLEVEMQGDAFLLAFPSSQRALRCAVGIQEALAAHGREHPEKSVRVRIGLHTGEAIHDADGFFGKTVIVTARIAALADGGEILASSLLKEAVEQSDGLDLASPREVHLKGLVDPYTVYPVRWTHSGD